MSKKFKFQLFLLFAALALAILLFPDGKPKMPGLAKLPAKKTHYYKWQDAEGNWHMSDQAPDGIEAQRLVADPNANIIQSIAVPQDKTASKKNQDNAQISANPAVYLSRAKQTMQDAEEAKDLLNQRQQELEDFVSGKQR